MANNPSPTKLSSALSSWLATGAVLAVAIGLVSAQSEFSKDPASQFALAGLAQRVPVLQSTTDPVKRDSYCIPLSAYGRALDQAIAPDAHVFISEMLGDANGGRMGFYYFLRNYLYPRPVEISLDGKAVLTDKGALGIASDSPEEIQKHGFDLLMRPSPDGGFQLVPLTPKGELKGQSR